MSNTITKVFPFFFGSSKKPFAVRIINFKLELNDLGDPMF